MKVLVEHSLTTPYTGEIHDGTAKSAMLLKEKFNATMLGTADSTLDCLKSTVHSGKSAGRMNMRGWYEFILNNHHQFDKIILNHPLTSQSLLDLKHKEWMCKSTYLNHDGTQWMIEGNAGLRLSAALRFFRSCGGVALYLSDKNRRELERVANHHKKSKFIEQYASDYSVKTNGIEYLELDLFDGQFDQSQFFKMASRAKSLGYAISIGRPDKSKRLTAAAKKAKELGVKHKVFCTSVNTSSQSDYANKCIDEMRELGSEVYLDVEHSEIMKQLSHSEFLILSSVNETFCHVAMEALSFGIPVMAYEVPPSMIGHEDMLLEWK